MKIIQLITFLAIGSAAWILSSCCSKDKDCPAGSPSLGSLPYQFNQQLVFADSAGKSIRVQMNNGFVLTPEYGIDGSCSMPRKEGYCESSISLKHASVIDSSGLLAPNERYFSTSIHKGEDMPVDYGLSAFGSVFFYINDYGNTNTIFDDVPVSVYTTPYKTYNNVHTNTVASAPYTPGYRSKVVYSQAGTLISFSLGADTTHIFYLVE